MITYLKVRNLAIVEELAIEPGAGLNVLTGETGAGKSLLIDSLEFLRGARGSSEMIRAGSDKMTAEAVFHLPKSIAKSLDALGVDVDVQSGGVELIVRREIASGGRGRVLVNGSPLSVRELGAAMDAVLEIHGQHESQFRVAGQTYRELVDEYAGHDELLDTTRDAHREWKLAADQLQEMTEAQRDRALRLDLLKYQVDEISAAKLDPAEEDALRNEKAILSHAREMIEATSGAFQLIDEDESSAIAQLGRALH
ncbi:MAG TPA: AAA family ATPase, partial [Thermoanaerobaculia bacterium]|nr:AAA family ATPase [Thermoanaerobaculia bacterium]